MSRFISKDNAHLVLGAHCARELMTLHVVTIRDTATVKEAVELLTDHEISAVPVVDEAGCPVGVLSRSDVVAHDCEKVEYLAACGGNIESVLRTHAIRAARHKVRAKNAQSRLVSEIMTPVLFAVAADTPASSVVDAMLALKVHRLFVTDSDDNLLGVISAIDVLRHLRRNEAE